MKAELIEKLISLLLDDSANKQHSCVGEYVLVRTYAAGVHFGELKSYDAQTKDVVLTDARRLYYWRGAFTLSEVTQKGIDFDASKISCSVPSITITAIEIIPIAKELIETFKKAKSYEC